MLKYDVKDVPARYRKTIDNLCESHLLRALNIRTVLAYIPHSTNAVILLTVFKDGKRYQYDIGS